MAWNTKIILRSWRKRDADAREIGSSLPPGRQYYPDVNPGDPRPEGAARKSTRLMRYFQRMAASRLPEKLTPQQRGLFEEQRGISEKGG